MHNLKELRKNLDNLKKKFENRNTDFDINDFKKKDSINRDLINKKEKLEQEKKTLSKQPLSTRICAASNFGSVTYEPWHAISLPSFSLMTSIIFGCACPKEATAMPAAKSRYFLPSVS